MEIYLAIDWVFNTLMNAFEFMKSNWITAMILIISVMSLIINLIVFVRGSK